MKFCDNMKKTIDFGQSYTNRYMNYRRFETIKKTLDKILKLRRNSNEIRILEIGCWDGRNIFKLKNELSDEYNIEFKGIDISNKDIKKAQVKSNENDNKCSFNTMDINNMTFPDNSFDIVLASEVLEHLKDPKEIVEKISKVLKTGGFFVITVPHKGGGLIMKILNCLRRKNSEDVNEEAKNISGEGFGHISVLAHKEWKKIFKETGFKVEKVKGTSGLFFGNPELDKHKIIFAFSIILDSLLERFPFSYLWYETTLYQLKKC